MEQPEDETELSQSRDGDPSDGTSKANSNDALPEAPTQSGFARLAKKITDWTSNFLATSIIAIIAVVAGSHMVSTFRPVDSYEEAMESDLMSAWPELESCALEFGDSSLQIQRESLVGTAAQALSSLRTQCRSALEEGAPIADEIGEQEMSLIASVVNAKDAKPVEQAPGRWRIFKISAADSADENSKPEFPMVVGVRDDLGESEATSKGSRVAVWGLAMPRFDTDKSGSTGKDRTSGNTASSGSDSSNADKANVETSGEWTTFVATPLSETDETRFKATIIPSEFQRTLAIANPNGGSMVGMVGDSIEHAIQFYDSLASREQWKVSSPWQQNEDTWSARFKLPKESPFKGIQVQLHVNHNEKVRGMLMLNPS